jgi:hypothetical protein
MTLREWCDAHPGRTLDGLVLRIPPGAEGMTTIPQRELAIRSAWAMPPDQVGVWFMVSEDLRAGVGKAYPITGIDREALFTWEVVE